MAAVVAFATGSAGTAAGLALGGDGGDGQFDVVAFATGSAGTAAGLALGLHLAGSRTLARAYTQEAIEVLAEAMRNATTADARIKAATALLDRGWGKPAQQLSAEINDTKVVTINLGWVSGRSVGGCVIEQRDAPQISSD